MFVFNCRALILQDDTYFECAAKHGVLVDPHLVLLSAAGAEASAAVLLNPLALHDEGPEPTASPGGSPMKTEAGNPNTGYLQVEPAT